MARRPAGALRISDAGIRLIVGHEGKRNRLYNDPAGHCTIGIGHLVHRGRCDGRASEARFADGLSDEQVYRLFRDEDVPRYEADVRRLVRVPLNQCEFDALVSYDYNLGPGNVSKSACLARLNSGDYEAAAVELATWPPNPSAGQWGPDKWSKAPGLFRRRREEAALFRFCERDEQTTPKEVEMFLFWHEGGLFAGSPPWRSSWGLAPGNCDALIAAGVPVLGRHGEPSELFGMLAPTDALVGGAVKGVESVEAAGEQDYAELIEKWGL